jgi:hypothetical protein
MMSFFIWVLPFLQNFPEFAILFVMEGIIFLHQNVMLFISRPILLISISLGLLLLLLWTFMVQNPNGNTTSSMPNNGTNGSGKKPTSALNKLVEDSHKISKEIFVAGTGSFVSAYLASKLLVHEKVIKATTVNNFPAAPFIKSSCVLGGAFIVGCTVLGRAIDNHAKVIEKAKGFIPSPAE